MDRGAWRATVHRVAELDTTEATERARAHTHTHTHTHTQLQFRAIKCVYTVVQATPPSLSGTASSSRAETLYLTNHSRLPSPQPPFCLSLSLTDRGTACK